MVDAPDLGSGGESRVGSSPTIRTLNLDKNDFLQAVKRLQGWVGSKVVKCS